MAEQSKRKQFTESIKSRLDEINKEIDRLEERAREASGEAEEKYREQLKAVREKRSEVKQKLDELQTASEAQWEKIKLDVDYAWKAFNNSVSYFRSHFK
jgi:predicted ribosome quality control (RQC) complex YloA/Tae2 family protein